MEKKESRFESCRKLCLSYVGYLSQSKMTKIILIINDERGLKYFNCKEEFVLKTSKLRSSN